LMPPILQPSWPRLSNWQVRDRDATW
jgi:hypothetical protein